MENEISFGKTVKDHRLYIGLSQAELAGRVGCATITLRKIESEVLRPSAQMAERLSLCLEIPPAERAEFVRLARRSPLLSSPSSGRISPTPSAAEIGAQDLRGRAVHGYELAERIGAGGFGVVYRAFQPAVEREVAIKIILPAYANHPDFIRQFETEARLIARLEHPHIVPLYDYWRELNAAYLVMRLLRGGSLGDLLRQGPLESALALRILDQVGSALHIAHRSGVVHCDLKPTNILLDEDHNAYLGDFGIARILGASDLTDPARFSGGSPTPAYHSPEQLRCEPLRPQADIYCLALLIFEMLSGSLPFPGPTPQEMLEQQFSQPLPALVRNNQPLSPPLDQVLQRAVANDPAARYPDVPGLLAEVHLALSQTFILPLAEQPGDHFFPENPYKGLRAFEEADANDFFGHEVQSVTCSGA